MSLQVVIGLCKRKETAALKSKPPFQMGVDVYKRQICDRIEAICPNAWLINFTNPSGIITEFVLNHTNVKCMGLCLSLIHI